MKKNVVDLINQTICCSNCHAKLVFSNKKNQTIVCECGTQIVMDEGLILFPCDESNWLNEAITKKAVQEFMQCEKDFFPDSPWNKEDAIDSLKMATQKLANSINNNAGQVILDMSGQIGPLYINEKFKEKNKNKIFIITNNQEMHLRMIKDILDKQGYKNNVYITCDLKRIPLLNNTVDSVVSMSVFQNTNMPTKVFTEAIRVLKTFGNLIDLSFFFEEKSKSLEFANLLGSADLITSEKYFSYLATKSSLSYMKEDTKKYSGKFQSDLFPLKDDYIEPILVNIKKEFSNDN